MTCVLEVVVDDTEESCPHGNRRIVRTIDDPIQIDGISQVGHGVVDHLVVVGQELFGDDGLTASTSLGPSPLPVFSDFPIDACANGPIVLGP